MWDEALKCPHLNPLPEGEYVFCAKLKAVCDCRPGHWLLRQASIIPGASEGPHLRLQLTQGILDNHYPIARSLTPKAFGVRNDKRILARCLGNVQLTRTD